MSAESHDRKVTVLLDTLERKLHSLTAGYPDDGDFWNAPPGETETIIEGVSAPASEYA